MDAVDVLAKQLPPLKWIVQDVVPEGLSVFAGAPKIGKSCLLYQIAVEVALGGWLFGRRVEPGAALFLSLEDGIRRGQTRLNAALAGRTMPRGRLEMRWDVPNIGEGLEELLVEWMAATPDAKFIGIDTLQRVRPKASGKRSQYEVDVEDLSRLHGLMLDLPTNLTVVHHTNQAGSDDFLKQVSGTSGIPGTADTVGTLKRRVEDELGTLQVVGRDAAPIKLSLAFKGLTWGEAPAGLPEARHEQVAIYRVIEAHGPIHATAVARHLGLDGSDPSVRVTLQNQITQMRVRGNLRRVPKGYVVADLNTKENDR